VPERSTAMRQAEGADESCASLRSPWPQKGPVSAPCIAPGFAERNAKCVSRLIFMQEGPKADLNAPSLPSCSVAEQRSPPSP
jgi:hypothetical protein